MLKFYRKVKSGLFDGGRSSWYLMYALGEIVLVVVGILIALQINNWNEYRNDRHKERQYLIALRNELVQDTIIYRSMLNSLAGEEAGARYVLKGLDNPEIISRDSMKFIESFRVSLENGPGQTRRPIVWEELQSTGHLSLITNRDLVNHIQNFYNGIMNWHQYTGIYLGEFIFAVRNKHRDHFSLEEIDDFWRQPIRTTKALPKPETFNNLIGDPELKRSLKDLVISNNGYRMNMLSWIQQMKDLVNEINRELN